MNLGHLAIGTFFVFKTPFPALWKKVAENIILSMRTGELRDIRDHKHESVAPVAFTFKIMKKNV